MSNVTCLGSNFEVRFKPKLVVQKKKKKTKIESFKIQP